MAEACSYSWSENHDHLNLIKFIYIYFNNNSIQFFIIYMLSQQL
jgi:hypothetical protein